MKISNLWREIQYGASQNSKANLYIKAAHELWKAAIDLSVNVSPINSYYSFCLLGTSYLELKNKTTDGIRSHGLSIMWGNFGPKNLYSLKVKSTNPKTGFFTALIESLPPLYMNRKNIPPIELSTLIGLTPFLFSERQRIGVDNLLIQIGSIKQKYDWAIKGLRRDTDSNIEKIWKKPKQEINDDNINKTIDILRKRSNLCYFEGGFRGLDSWYPLFYKGVPLMHSLILTHLLWFVFSNLARYKAVDWQKDVENKYWFYEPFFKHLRILTLMNFSELFTGKEPHIDESHTVDIEQCNI